MSWPENNGCDREGARHDIAIAVTHCHKSGVVIVVVAAIVAVATGASERERGTRGVTGSDFGLNSGG